jgi:hypothetical protein
VDRQGTFLWAILVGGDLNEEPRSVATTSGTDNAVFVAGAYNSNRVKSVTSSTPQSIDCCTPFPFLDRVDRAKSAQFPDDLYTNLTDRNAFLIKVWIPRLS